MATSEVSTEEVVRKVKGVLDSGEADRLMEECNTGEADRKIEQLRRAEHISEEVWHRRITI